MNGIETFKEGVETQWLTDLLLKCMAEPDPDPMLSMLEWLCAQLMEVEVSGIVGEEKNVYSPSRSDYRCGYRPRRLDTRIGTLYLMVRKLCSIYSGLCAVKEERRFRGATEGDLAGTLC